MNKSNAKTAAYRYCQCGWAGQEQRLAVWIRDNHIIARICPRCGSTAIKRTPSPSRPPEGSLLH